MYEKIREWEQRRQQLEEKRQQVQSTTFGSKETSPILACPLSNLKGIKEVTVPFCRS